MANVPQNPPPLGVEPTTFGQLFQTMPDVYNGTYSHFLAEYAPDDAVTGTAVMLNTITRFPTTQVPAVFAYVGVDGMINTVHHIHRVEVPFGQPSPWTDTILGFSGDVYNTQIAYLQVGVDDFFDNTPATQVPTAATMGAALAALAVGTLQTGPFNANDPDTEEVCSRRAVPVPYPYIALMFGRQLTPREAWEQVGAQVILDQREADCSRFLDFLRLAGVSRRPRQGQRGAPSVLSQPTALQQPLGDPLLLDHIGRRLRMLLPITMAPAAALGPQFAQATMVLRQALQEDRDVDRMDRAAVAEAQVNATAFSVVFPAVANSIRRLCEAADDDERLPTFWQMLAAAKGKKAQSMSAFTQLVTARANQPDSTGILPVVTTQLFNQIAHFELGSADLLVITNGISPFIMCPLGYSKASTEHALTQQYLMIHSETGSNPTLADVQKLLTPTYNLPDSLHQLADFIGAYSIIWDVLVGPENPIAQTIRSHYRYWHSSASRIKADLSLHLQGHVMMGTMRAIQLEILGYVNRKLYSDEELPLPSLDHIEATIRQGLYTLPALPERYWTPSNTTTMAPTGTTVIPTAVPKQMTSGTPINAPPEHVVAAWHEAFAASSKSVQQLKMLPTTKRPKTTKNGLICLAYHLRGTCYDNCRFHQTHRKLSETESTAMKKFLDAEL